MKGKTRLAKPRGVFLFCSHCIVSGVHRSFLHGILSGEDLGTGIFLFSSLLYGSNTEKISWDKTGTTSEGYCVKADHTRSKGSS